MKACLITCTYGPDLERCQALCSSTKRFLSPDIEHVLVIPHRDVAHATARGLLEHTHTRLVVVEDVLPSWIRQIPGQRRWWITPFSPPVRGWIIQQIVKLSADSFTQADALIFADSDVQLVRPLEIEHLIDNTGRLRLHRLDGSVRKRQHRRWDQSASRLLGLPHCDNYHADYIAQLACWRRNTLQRLQEQLTTLGNRDWRKTLCRTQHFSEYVLYGVFAQHLMGHASGHYIDSQDLCHCSWHHPFNTPDDLKCFVSGLKPQHRAVLFQSYLPITAPSSEAYLANFPSTSPPLVTSKMTRPPSPTLV
ncbi:MAG: DUF6492 family protein [Algisphaera sp.]